MIPRVGCDMKSIGRWGDVGVIPADISLCYSLLAIAAIAWAIVGLLTRAPLDLLFRHPRAFLRALVAGATARGEVYFWVVWITFGVGLMCLAGALLVAYVVWRGV